ncbi:adenylyltransferase/cytidyltransferase family protein [Candidatus Pacearchaeota archaeon]|nr:adenylyltransferase/cytidyltransferase family protein [Candidatus Pacearchaeota archaeon]
MKIIINSGYFDPLHVGHLECMKLSRELGDKLIVIVNNDYQCAMKKNEIFMPANERLEIVRSIRYVDDALLAIDRDKSVCASLTKIARDYKGNELIFAKGGDRFSGDIPERRICENHGIKIVDGLGEKIQSSSWLIRKSK